MHGRSAEQLMEAAQRHHARGDIRTAADLYRRVLEAQPEDPEAIHLLGLVHRQMGEFENALRMMQRSIALKPTEQYFYKNLGELHRAMGALDAAIAAFQTAIDLMPSDGSAFVGLGQVQQALGQDSAALDSYARAVELDPGDPTAHLNLGVLLERQGDYAAALRQFDLALRLNPGYALAHIARAFALLRKGELADGLREYEWRWRIGKSAGFVIDPNVPVWDGGDLGGRRIVVHAEQGLGDTLHFARYVPMVAARGGEVIFEVQPELERLLRGDGRFGTVLPRGSLLPRHDSQISLMSLPHQFGTTLSTIPAAVPYIRNDAQLVEHWRQRMASDQKLKVGLTWAGGPLFPGDKRRSTTLATFAPLAAVPEVSFYSLQVGPQAGQALRPPDGMGLVDLGPELKDFADTAAALTQLDLVISVDTSVVHLAGAMGRAVWVLIPFVPEWRWFMDREDTPWYPTARLFRQRRLDDWGEPMARVAAALRTMASERPR